MKYKHITIEPSYKEGHGHYVYRIVNNKSNKLLGMIFWYAQWRQYVCEFTAGRIFNNSCLRDIIKFIEERAGEEEK